MTNHDASMPPEGSEVAARQPLSDRFAQFPQALASNAVTMPVAGVPCLLVHPDWQTKRPMLLWMHGRTANKELDAGRYLRCIRAGIACCAIDLPGHGERAQPHLQSHGGTLDVIVQAQHEIDSVLEELVDGGTLAKASELAAKAKATALATYQGPSPVFEGGSNSDAPALQELFNIDACLIGGMSLGGMSALVRLCSPHAFVGAVVECSTGWLEGLYLPQSSDSNAKKWPVQHDPQRVRELDPMKHLEGFSPIPLLAMHSVADAVVPWQVQRAFLDALRSTYVRRGVSPSHIEVRTWPTTGAPDEHSGFGKVAAEAKTTLVDFALRVLGVAKHQ
jgi:hypothetical protein